MLKSITVKWINQKYRLYLSEHQLTVPLLQETLYALYLFNENTTMILKETRSSAGSNGIIIVRGGSMFVVDQCSRFS